MADIDLNASFEASGIGPVLEQLDRELIGLQPGEAPHPRDRRTSAGGQAAP